MHHFHCSYSTVFYMYNYCTMIHCRSTSSKSSNYLVAFFMSYHIYPIYMEQDNLDCDHDRDILSCVNTLSGL